MLGIVSDPGSSQGPPGTPPGGSHTGDLCIPNISPRERRRRLAGGAVPFVLALAFLALLMATGAQRGWRLALLPLFWGAALGFFQWRDKTWVALAARGSRKLGEAVEKIESADELAQVRRQALRVHLKSLLAAVLLTLAALALPAF